MYGHNKTYACNILPSVGASSVLYTTAVNFKILLLCQSTGRQVAIMPLCSMSLIDAWLLSKRAKLLQFHIAPGTARIAARNLDLPCACLGPNDNGSNEKIWHSMLSAPTEMNTAQHVVFVQLSKHSRHEDSWPILTCHKHSSWHVRVGHNTSFQ